MSLAFVAFQKLVRRQLGVVDFVGRQDETTVLVDEGLASRERRGQGPFDVIDHLVGVSPLSGASSLAIAGRSAHGTAVEEGGLYTLRAGR